MNQTAKEQLRSHLTELCECYGPWDVLYVCTEAMRPFFEEQAKKDAPPKRVRKSRVKAMQTEEVDTAVYDATFPDTEREHYLCGLLCDLVAKKPGLTGACYLDAIHCIGRAALLPTPEARREFAELSASVPPSDNNLTPWGNLTNLLSKVNAIKIDGDLFRVGSKMVLVRDMYPDIPPRLVELIHQAASQLRELQKRAGLDYDESLSEVL